ncbi:hypothetical protein, partial [Thiolapillus sp.]|uniref:hypothetical protein n=1 Tax=Thiolapillus sp. TaxID=2017437 RepID=UPI003AF51DF2
MTRTAGAPIGCQRPSRFWGLGCPKIYHEAEDTLVISTGNGDDLRPVPDTDTPVDQGVLLLNAGQQFSATDGSP